MINDKFRLNVYVFDSHFTFIDMLLSDYELIKNITEIIKISSYESGSLVLDIRKQISDKKKLLKI